MRKIEVRSIDQLTINALNNIWCSNFFMPRICWNISYNCSFDRMISLFSGCCIREGFLVSSSPVPFRIQSNLAIHDVDTVSLFKPSMSGNDRLSARQYNLKHLINKQVVISYLVVWAVLLVNGMRTIKNC